MIIVTGGTHGIGAAVVRALSMGRHRVLFTGRDKGAGQELEAQTKESAFIQADSAEPSDIERVVQHALRMGGGVLNGLVNNAGMSARSAFDKLTLQEWDAVFAVNTRSVFQYTQLALPALQASGGAVVNVASIAGKVGEEGLAAYCASKAAVIGLTQALALEYGDRVRFNAICPGQIGTRMMDRVVQSPARLTALTARIPAGRLGSAAEVAEVVTWLLSPAASFVNGAVLTVDGGETAGYRTPAVPPAQGV